MKFLITGIPGMGKTTIGDYLAAEHGFEHVDLEDASISERLFASPETFRAEVAELAASSQPAVVTWGFPVGLLRFVLRMRAAGFEWVWLDGDRVAARRAFVARGTVREKLLDVQLDHIDTFLDLDAFKPRLLNTFDADGEFRSLADIAAELLGAAVARRARTSGGAHPASLHTRR